MPRLKLGSEKSSKVVNDLINRIHGLDKRISGRKIALKSGSVMSRHIISRVKKRTGLPYTSKYRKRRKAMGLTTRAIVEIGKKQLNKNARRRRPPISYKVTPDGKGGYKAFVGWYSGSLKTGNLLDGNKIAEIREARRKTIYIDSSSEQKVNKAINTIINRAVYFFYKQKPGRKKK
jgi:hypothetical protein